jgi:hypothetical protein
MSFVIATENKNLTRRANHRHERIIATSARISEAMGGWRSICEGLGYRFAHPDYACLIARGYEGLS